MSSRIWLILGIGLLLLLGLQFLSSGTPMSNEVPLSDLAAAIRAGQISQIVVRADTDILRKCDFPDCMPDSSKKW